VVLRVAVVQRLQMV